MHQALTRTVLALFTILSTVQVSFTQDLHLNEIMASNSMTFRDADGDYEDWVELYNSSHEPINLEGYGLSDRRDDPFMWIFPDTTIEAQSFLLVWASGKDRVEPGAELHSNFRISRSGEWVILTHPGEERVDELPATEIPTDISIGRYPDGNREGGWHLFNSPTPNRPNVSEPYREKLDPPRFFTNPGFYNSDFELQIYHADSQVEIRYTLDGSEPTKESSLYQTPILITDRSDQPNVIADIPTTKVTEGSPPFFTPESVKKGTIVRAAAFKEGRITSRSVSGTYFVFPQAQEKYSLPVVSVITEMENFFDDTTGIYVPGISYNEEIDGSGNYSLRGDVWERAGYLEYFDEDGQLKLSQNVGYRIHGGWTRRYPQKTLRVYARNRYETRIMDHGFFPERENNEYRRLLLRAAGNDFERAHMRDAAMHTMVNQLNLEKQSFSPAVVFINGEYWGIKHIRERMDEHYLEQLFGVDPDNVDILTARNRFTLEADVKEGCATHYNSMTKFITEEDMAESQNYEMVQTMMDTENYLNLYAVQVFIANVDWPHNNNDFWRLRTEYDPDAPEGHDGRWRWMLYDLDHGLGSIHAEPDTNMLTYIMNPRSVNQMFINLMQNETFKADFINRVADLMNSYFKLTRVTATVDSIASLLRPEIPAHLRRWHNNKSITEWQQEVDFIKQSAEIRHSVLPQHLIEMFNLHGTSEVTLSTDISKGHIKINSLHVNSDLPGADESVYPWKGLYYGGNRITLKAVPGEGYELSSWVVNGETHPEGILVIDPTEEMHIEAVFREETSAIAFKDKRQLLPNLEHFAISDHSIRFSVSEVSAAKITLYDLRGRTISQLADGRIGAGNHVFIIDRAGLANGFYLLRFELNGRVLDRRVLITR
ncbi:CotH kinase family protein [Chitinispirillales bacterium ANBcel5]|uniref:CotH kinase family protein n=1 Tax=Cellulosispirillum alkaliphilum TaxID=3039283 RepID=UPI002A575AD5|nr:CotH kinase family protein [Chitinispirillales bacterium ANBcel5]